MTCYTGGGMAICTTGPTEVIRREALSERWCFQCRKRVPFELIVTADTKPSYYAPNLSVQCSPRGHRDGDCGFGSSREWGGYA